MAESFLAVLSVGYFADRFARAVRWSPVAKRIRVSGVEGPSASLFAGMTGTVRSVEGGIMVLEPDRIACSEWADWSHLRLTARHSGWTPFSMCLVPIAVVVEAVRSDGQSGPTAIGTATVVRYRDRVSRN